MPDSTEALALGLHYQRAGQLHQAEQVYRQVLETDPANADALSFVGEICLAQNRLGEAVAAFQQALQLRPHSVELHNDMGVALAQQGKTDHAAACFRQALGCRPDYVEAFNNLGIVLSQQGKLTEAVSCYQQALSIKADYAEAHSNLGLALASLGKLPEAIASHQQALAIKPDFIGAQNNLRLALVAQERLNQDLAGFRMSHCYIPDDATAYNELGLALKTQGRLTEAIASFQEALRLRTDFAEAYNNLGVTFKERGNADEAVASLRDALSRNPDFVEAHNNLGTVLESTGNLDEASSCYRRALRGRPDFAEAHHNLGNVLNQLGKHAEALTHYQQAVELKPDYRDGGGVVTAPRGPDNQDAADGEQHQGRRLADTLALAIHYHESGELQMAARYYRQVLAEDPEHADALYRLGGICLALRQFDEAVVNFQQLLRLWPNEAAVHSDLGIGLARLGKLDEAVASFRKAVSLNPQYAEAYNSLGIALAEQGQYDEAVGCYQQALALKSHNPEACYNLGNLLRDRGQLLEAQANYQQALRFKPDHAEAHTNLAMTWLLLGDFGRGWPGYEWRWKTPGFACRPFSQPLWDGSPLAGCTILLHAEQGLGDTLQFIRYAPLVKQRGGFVIVECQQTLLPLLATCPGIDELIPYGSTLPAFDMQAPLMSLPLLLGTHLATLPADVPYLSAPPERREHWRTELAATQAFKVGVFLQGDPRQRKNRQRSLPLAAFAPLARLVGVQLCSLQKGPGAEQVAEAAGRFPLIDLGSRFENFADTAAALVNLDLIITVDSAVAHCAGALGVPVWTLLHYAADWRWLLYREDSPWYPTMRLFRQKEPGNWDDVLARVAAELSKQLAISSTGQSSRLHMPLISHG